MTRRRRTGLLLMACLCCAGARTAARDVHVEIVAPAPPAQPRPVFTIEKIESLVRPLLDGGCDDSAIASALARRYRFLGYVPAIDVTCGADDVRVRVRESSAVIDRITFDVPELSAIGVKVDPEFEEKVHLYPVPSEAPRAVLRGLLSTHPGDLYNHERYRADRDTLTRLGYIVAFVAGTEDEAGYPRGAYLIQSLTPRAPGSSKNRKTNYIGGTASYGPRSGGAAGLLYEKDQLFGTYDRLSVSPTWNSGAGGTIGYDAALLADRAAPRRMYDLGLSLYSDFTHNRQLGTVSTDERQIGFSGTLGIRPLAIEAPHAIRFEVGFRSQRVALDQAPPGEAEGATDSVEFGAAWDWRHSYRWPSLAVHFAPRVDVALRATGGERTFVRPGIDATLHSRHASGVETDLHLLLGTLNRDVPSFEQWSLGGPASVRGFKEDSYLGRHLAALQAEIWFPFVRPPASEPPPETPLYEAGAVPVEPAAARLLKWALFVDGGTISGSFAGDGQSIGGAGLGLRFLVPRHPLVIRADYARGFGAEGARGYPYVTLSYRY